MPFTNIGIEVSYSAAAAGSCVVEWGTYTTTGTGTTVTAQKYGADQSVAAILGTVKIADTVEPAGFARGALPGWIIPEPGMYSILYPSNREFYQPISINRGVRLTSTLACNVIVSVYIEQ
jgi:hypothetical protein